VVGFLREVSSVAALLFFYISAPTNRKANKMTPVKVGITPAQRNLEIALFGGSLDYQRFGIDKFTSVIRLATAR